MPASAWTTPVGSFGLPPDAAAWWAFGLGLVLLCGAWLRREQLHRLCTEPRAQARLALSTREQVALLLLALAAALLSAGYVEYYLRGGPRIIDATSYWLESRAFATGQVGFDVASPTANFRGRFLLPDGTGSELAPIFPPGYPALLALGQLLGAPLLVGPLTAALLVLCTFACARELFPERPAVWWLSAVFSVFSGCLRYHTADTMSHGLCALLVVTGLWCGLSARSAGGRRRLAWWLGAGLSVGWLLATRPVSALALLGVLAWLASRSEQRLRAAAALIAGCAPLVGLLVWHQYAATGSLGGSTQLAYYALADGPPGCFGYGFGARGCLYEHGDFVAAQMPHGYGPWQAVATSARRLKAHLSDAANFPIFTLALPLIAWFGRRQAAVQLLALGLALQVLVYAPFYFDGNYPGGGARFLVDALPLEHMLLASGIAHLRFGYFAPGLCLLGFSLHTSFEHRHLAEREGGRPMFEASQLPPLPHGSVVFVDTDHGFNLGHDPSLLQRLRRGDTGPPMVARRSYDSRERLLLQALGGPPAYNYAFDPWGDGAPSVSAFSPTPEPEPGQAFNQRLGRVRLEAEADYPPVRVEHGWVHPEWPPGDCVGRRRGLRFRGAPERAVRVRLELVAGAEGRYRVDTHWASMREEAGWVELGALDQAAPRTPLQGVPGACVRVQGPLVELAMTGPDSANRSAGAGAGALGRLPTAWLEVAVTTENFVLDWVELTPAP